jgi:hypothetical protein
LSSALKVHRGLQRNRTSGRYLCLLEFLMEIYDDELAHAIMEAEKPYNLLSAS